MPGEPAQHLRHGRVVVDDLAPEQQRQGPVDAGGAGEQDPTVVVQPDLDVVVPSRDGAQAGGEAGTGRGACRGR